MRRRLIFWILIIGFIWVVVTRFTEIQKLYQTLRQGQWEWVVAAGLIQVVFYVVITGTYQSAFDTVEVKSSLVQLLPVTLSSIFVNVVAPFGGAGGAALFVDDARHRGESPSRAAAGLLLQLIAYFSGFTIVLIAGLVYLFNQHDLQTYEIIATALLIIITFGLSGVMMLGLWLPDFLRKLLVWLQNFSNGIGRRIHRKNLFPDEWAEHNSAEFSNAALAISQHPVRLLRTLGIALVAHMINILCLYVLFRAFNQNIMPGSLIAGYAMGILFWIVSITPQGIGVVEGIMALIYTSLGIPAEVATTVVLAFRGLTFWLPLGLGFLLIRRVNAFDRAEPKAEKSWTR